MNPEEMLSDPQVLAGRTRTVLNPFLPTIESPCRR